MGGLISSRFKTDKIYYAMSKDMCCHSITNIWQMSQISLPVFLQGCKCMILEQSTEYPKLIILGGGQSYYQGTQTHLKYELYDILGYDTFNRFMLGFNKVCCIFFNVIFMRIYRRLFFCAF